MPRLERPSLAYAKSFQSNRAALAAAADPGYVLDRHEQIMGDFPAYLQYLDDCSAGRNLPEGWVPQDTWWLIDETENVLGEVRIRHRLSPPLEDWGGHIGYAIGPEHRRKGHGTLILKLALEKARAMGITRALVTCAADNIASARIIQKNGGQLASESMSRGGVISQRYWIDL